MRRLLAILFAGSFVLLACTTNDGEGEAVQTPPPSPPAATSTATEPDTPEPMTSPEPESPQATSSPPALAEEKPPPKGDWSSGPVSVERELPAPIPVLVAVRSAHHEGYGFAYDRIVWEFENGIPGYEIRYGEVRADGSGEVVELDGHADLSVVFYPAQAHNDAGRSAISGPSSGGGLPAVHEYRLVSDFEAYITYGVGLDDVVGFKVLELTNPYRLVIDFSA